MSLASASSSNAFGVYLHVPFCNRRCDYCAFATWDDRPHLIGAYVEALCTEIRRAAPALPPATSVFLGGGTPPLLTPAPPVSVHDEVTLAPDARVPIKGYP